MLTCSSLSQENNQPHLLTLSSVKSKKKKKKIVYMYFYLTTLPNKYFPITSLA